MQAPDIISDVQKYLLSECQVLPHRSNWASVLGDRCLRKQTYYRTHWDKQTPPSATLQGIFNTGKKLERLVKNILNEIGHEANPQWELIDTGVKLNDKFLNDHQIGGEPDVFLKVWPINNNGRPEILGPVEIKTVNPNIFSHIQTLEDFKKYEWMSHYPGQLVIYEIGSNFERGWFLLVNKSNLWDYKFIEQPLNYELADKLIQNADTINLHLKDKTLPEKINDPDTCPKCPFEAICLPEYTLSGNLKIIDDPELESILNRLADLETVKQEISDLEKMRDKTLIKGLDVAVGKFLILWSKIEKKAYTVAASEYWTKKIVKQAK